MLAWVGVAAATAPSGPIDRRALVTRHNIAWDDLRGQIPLGNGEFCFNADGTGLQTFGGNTMSHWGWHSFPLPAGVTPDQIPATGTFQKGRVTGPDVAPKEANAAAIRRWMGDNPHSFNLGRLRLVKSGGVALVPEDIQGLARTFDLWSGTQTSAFTIGGQPVRVVTCVHPELDQVAVRIESTLVARGEIEVALDFSYPGLRNGPWIGDFSRTEGNRTTMSRPPGRRADFRREVDAFTYYAALTWGAGCDLQTPAAPENGVWRLVAESGATSIEVTCAFSTAPAAPNLPGYEPTRQASSAHWVHFWSTGGAIDLSGSTDPRWRELERRIVLSQYLTAVQSAGSYPPAETGLMGIDLWRGQFHMEMVWWHLAHFALWDRWALADRALECYQRFLPTAQALAGQLGYKGFKWPKATGPEGRSAPWVWDQMLLWRQPHPIFFAELDYRLHPTRATLEKWDVIVQGTAEHMADYPVRDEQTGIYHLDPVMPPSEQGKTSDTVFDLAYWRWGLDQAQIWRERMGLAREPRWDEVRRHLAPLPVAEGVFVHSAEWQDTSYTKRAYEHPDPIGVFGMLPSLEGVDRATAHRTLLKVWTTWNWKRCWGWDFPWVAMAAARLGEPKLAVDALLMEAGTKNNYDQRGVCTGGPCPYLPGNGGLLYAAAMMAAGWDGAPSKHAPGFPDDGTWTVRWEGLKPAP
ncbi:MAG: hypothetical protein PSV13_20885 [Lacunisphaera sp.]|nr:hypothetical protein [Lacunisphaera sp.]